MCDKDHFAESVAEYEARGLITRRQFGVFVAAGVAMMLPQSADAQQTAERDVEIKTPDGTCDAYFVHPATGTGAAVIIWPDIFGLRPAMRNMAKRLAGAGYAVVVPNPFYRVGKTNFTGATPFGEIGPFRKGMGTQATDMSDARAVISWLDQQPQVNRNRRIGTQGYCMGGPMTFHTAAAVPDRVGAVASFHGGGLVGKDPATSPHTLAAATKASFLIAIAENDDKGRPMDKDVLKETFAKANRPAEIEVYPAAHGWCPPDTQVYNEKEAERAWTRLLALYKQALA